MRIGDGQLELCPGVYLASYTRLSLEERSSLPRGIAYCFREPDAAYGKGLKRVPRYVLGIPKVPNCEAVLIPRVFKISEVFMYFKLPIIASSTYAGGNFNYGLLAGGLH